MKHIYLYFLAFLIVSGAQAQFSSDPSNPLTLCSAPGMKRSIQAVEDKFSVDGGYYVFWVDDRSSPGNSQIYAQRVDKDGNLLWENNGRLIATHGGDVMAIRAKNWQNGILLCYVKNSDSVICKNLGSEGQNLWPGNVLVATSDYANNVIYVSPIGCFDIIPTTTGANISYLLAFTGGQTVLGLNRIDFSGNVLWGNNSKHYELSGYDYRVISDGTGGWYALSKGNGSGEPITIDRIDSNGALLWATGVNISDGGYGPFGFGGNISLNTDANHDLYVTWDAHDLNVYHTKVFHGGSLAWPFKRIALSTSGSI